MSRLSRRGCLPGQPRRPRQPRRRAALRAPTPAADEDASMRATMQLAGLALASALLSGAWAVRETKYNTMLTTFSPDGRLLQLEYAEEAARSGHLVVAATLPAGEADGARGRGVIIVSVYDEQRPALLEHDVPAGQKVSVVDAAGSVALGWTGVATDGLALVRQAREVAATSMVEGRCLEPRAVAEELSKTAHEATIMVTQRPLGVSAIVGGVDASGEPELLTVRPSGLLQRWHACAVGAGSERAVAELEARFGGGDGGGRFVAESTEGVLRGVFAAVRRGNQSRKACEVLVILGEGDGRAARSLGGVPMESEEAFMDAVAPLLRAGGRL